MANMSYCRFENTLRDLQDCKEAMSNDLDLSKSEQRSFVRMVKMCRDIAEMYEDCSDEELLEISGGED